MKRIKYLNHSDSFKVVRVLDGRCYAEKTVFPYGEIVLEVFSDSVCELSGGLTLLPEKIMCSQLSHEV